MEYTMTMNRRTRLISFRVSEEEYEALKHLRAVVGARSVSDMVRNSMLHVTAHGGDHGALEKLQSHFVYLEQRVLDLDRLVRDLAGVTAERTPTGLDSRVPQWPASAR
jgi:hypothetical protein